MVTFIVSDLIPLRKRGSWQGILNLVYGIGMSLGGFVGGFISDKFGWRWAFLFQVPLIFVTGALSYYMVNIPVKTSDVSRIKRIDFLGSTTIVAALVFLLLGLSSGGNTLPWSHPFIATSFVLSIAFLGAFVYIELNIASEPIIPIQLFATRTVWAACLMTWFYNIAVYALMYYGPLYFQVIINVDSAAAGVRLIPQCLGISTGSLACGYYMRVTGRYRLLNAFIQCISIISAALIWSTFGRSTALWTPFILLFMQGFVYGAILTIALIALISAVDHEYQAVITSAQYGFRSTGSTIGITLASLMFQNLLDRELHSRFGHGSDAEKRIARIRDSIDEIRNLPDSWYQGVMESYLVAFHGVWTVVVALCIAAAAASLFIKEYKLHSNLSRA